MPWGGGALSSEMLGYQGNLERGWWQPSKGLALNLPHGQAVRAESCLLWSSAALPGPRAWDGCGWQGSFQFAKVEMFLSNSFLLPEGYLWPFLLGHLGQMCRKKHTKVVLRSCYE